MDTGHLLPDRKRPRLPRLLYRGGYFFSVTIATRLREPWFERHPLLAAELGLVIESTARERGSALFAWCIMPEHVHLLVQDEDLVAFVRLVKGRITPLARRLLPHGRALWQQSFYDHALRGEESVNDVAEYIFSNPVRRGLVLFAGSYEWSGSTEWPNWRELFGRG